MPGATELAATSTARTGTVNRRAIAALAARYSGEGAAVIASPLIVAAAGSRALGKDGRGPQDLALAMVALISAAGSRTDAVLRTGDCPGCQLLAAAAQRLGWRPPEISSCPEKGHGPGITVGAHCGAALFRAGLNDEGTVECAAAMARAGVPVACWCDECGPAQRHGPSPCRKHSPAAVKAAWEARAWGARPAA